MLMRSGSAGNPLPGRASQAPFRSRLLSRRRLLALGTALGLTVGLSGCRPETVTAPPSLEPDELAVNRAVAAARTLRTGALALAGTTPELADLLRRTAAVHEQHLAALGAPITATSPTSGAASGSGSAADPAPTASPAPTPTPARLIKAELAASQTALRDGEAAAPAFAVLLCRIAAARIIHVDLLSAAIGRPRPGVLQPAPATSSPANSSAATPAAADRATTDPADAAGLDGPIDPADLTGPTTPAQVALDRLLAGEHATVFAYPLIIARTSGGRRRLAAELWQAHRTERDKLSARLLVEGIKPAVAEPAYDVVTLPTSSRRAAALAGRLERGLAALAANLLAAGSAADDDRILGADQLVLAARRMAGWTGKPTAFPGLVSRATPVATPSPSP